MSKPVAFDAGSGNLTHPSLRNMLNRGYDQECLAYLQQDAFIAAAQAMLRRCADGQTFSSTDLASFIDRKLSNPEFGGSHDEVSSSHIAHYIATKSMLQTLAPKTLLAEAETLAAIDQSQEIFDNDSRQLITYHLASHLVSIKQYANQFGRNYPSFAATLRAKVSAIHASYPDAVRLIDTEHEEENARVRRMFEDDHESPERDQP